MNEYIYVVWTSSNVYLFPSLSSAKEKLERLEKHGIEARIIIKQLES